MSLTSVFKSLLMSAGLYLSLHLNAQTNTDLTRFINTTTGSRGLFLYGRTIPFVTPPFGMTDWNACTGNNRIGVPGYRYINGGIIGFRGSHKPAMWMGDYGYMTMMPTRGKMCKSKLHLRIPFIHSRETAKPDYYKVHFGGMTAEITATVHCGFLQFKFTGPRKPLVKVEASQTTEFCRVPALYTGHPFRKRPPLPSFDGWIHIDTAHREISGWNTDRQSFGLGPALPNFKGYFVIQFDEPFTTNGTWVGDTLTANSTEQLGNICGGWVNFKKGTKAVHARVGTSFISIEQARENLSKEVAGKSFDEVRTQTKKEWNTYLNRIEIDGATKKQSDIFYTGMYHALLFPRQFSEYGKYYSAFDDKIHNGVSYNDYSLWDTYRAEHPLLLFIAPEHVPGMIQSLVQMYKEGGYMPKWPNPTYSNIMISTHADDVIADAVVKGVKGFNLEDAFKACYKDATVPPTGDDKNRWYDREPWSAYEARAGLSWYLKLGYVPVDKTAESVSNTIEGSYDDFCVAQVAKAAGHMGQYDTLMHHSQYFRNLYNKATGFMAPRNADGTWCADPEAGFTEGSKWTYLFGAQQDIPGLINLMGRDTFISRLDDNFDKKHYVHENEPGHHFCYLYDYAGQAWKTQMRVAKYRRIKYHDTPRGLNGDDDCGQMSAWYIFSALGFYPVTPGTDVYAVGTPLFKKAVVHFDPNDYTKSFEITANNVSKKNIYVQSLTINGKKVDTPFIHHADLINSSALHFEMADKPVKLW